MFTSSCSMPTIGSSQFQGRKAGPEVTLLKQWKAICEQEHGKESHKQRYKINTHRLVKVFHKRGEILDKKKLSQAAFRGGFTFAESQKKDTFKIRSEKLTRLHQDPEFAAAHAERSREKMTRVRQDPEFEQKRLAGLRDYWASLPPKLVYKVHTNVNTATGAIIDYGDKDQTLPIEALEQQDLKNRIQTTLHCLKAYDLQAFLSVVGQFQMDYLLTPLETAMLPYVIERSPDREALHERAYAFMAPKLADFKEALMDT
jgi:hypothetical protein